MINPRDIWLRALLKEGSPPQKDYFVYGSNFEIGASNKLDVDTLVKWRADPSKAPSAWKKATALFNNWENRVFLEGLLFAFGKEKVKTLKSFDSLALDYYCLHYFNSAAFSELDNRLIFLQFIDMKSAKDWFHSIMNRNIDEINYILLGKHQNENLDEREALKRMLSKSLGDFETFCAINPKEALNKGIDKNTKDLYELGLKAGALAKNILTTLVGLPDEKNKGQSPIEKLYAGLQVSKTPASSFHVVNEEAEEDIQAQYNIINPLRMADDTSLGTSSEEEDEGD